MSDKKNEALEIFDNLENVITVHNCPINCFNCKTEEASIRIYMLFLFLFKDKTKYAHMIDHPCLSKEMNSTCIKLSMTAHTQKVHEHTNSCGYIHGFDGKTLLTGKTGGNYHLDGYERVCVLLCHSTQGHAIHPRSHHNDII